MHPRIRPVLTATLAFLVALFAIWALDRWIVRPAFVEIEQAQAFEDAARARAAIDGELRELGEELSDWAQWDDAYAFAASHDPAFVASNLGDWHLLEKNSRLNLCFIFARDGQVLYGGGYDAQLGGFLTPAAFAGKTPPIWSMLAPRLAREEPYGGVLSTEHGLLLLAARPIVSTRGTGLARGMLVFGRILDDKLLRALGTQTQVTFDLLPANDPRLSPRERDYLDTLRTGEAVLRPAADGTQFVYEALAGLDGRALALLRTPIRQEISATAARTSQTLMGSLGLLVLALLLVHAWLRSRAERAVTDRHAAASGVTALVLLIGLTLTYGLFTEWRERSRQALTRDFQAAAAERAERVRASIENNLDEIETVRRFFTGVVSVSRQQFSTFVTPTLERHRFQALEWLPRVPHAQRAAYEAAARRDHLENFQFTESDAEGRLVRAGDRAEYFPVYYLEPHAGNAAALGFAPGPEHPARGAPLAKARDQGQLAATARYVLVQDRSSSERYSILVFAPVYHDLPMPAEVDQRRRHLRGFVLGVLRVGDMVSDALQGAEPGQLSFRLLDLTAGSEQGWLYDHPPGGAFPAATTSDLRFSRDFPLADRFWRIEVAPSAAFIARHHDQSYRWIPAGGGLLTLLAAMYLFALVAQRQRAEQLVAERTIALRASEAQFRQIIEHAPFGFHLYRLTADDRLLLGGANPAAEAMLGISQAQCMDRPVEEILPGLLASEIPNACRQLARTGGARRWERVTYGQPEKDESFEMVAFQTAPGLVAVAFVDITERRRAETALHDSEQRFRAMIEHAPDGIALFNGSIRYASPAVSHLLGYTPEEAMALDPEQATHPDDLPWLLPLLDELTRRPGDVVSARYRFRHKDGSWRWLESTISNLLHEPVVNALVFNFRDVTERQQAEAHLRLAAAVFEAARDAIMVTDKQWNIVAVNPAFSTLTGYAESEVRGRNPRLLWAERQEPAYFESMARTLAVAGVWQGEFWARRKDGERRAALASLGAVRDANGTISHHVGVATDITALKIAEQRIEHQAYYDALTDLPNRSLLAQHAELALARATRQRSALALLFLDLDQFKEVNDSLGHAEGDALLVQAAARLQEITRGEDTVCRLGGDEFVLLLPDTAQDGALRVADKLLTAFRQPFMVAGHPLRTTVSIGIALYPNDGNSFAELLKNADTALYQAKQEGRNTRVFYDRQMNAAILQRLVLESELRQALASGQLRAYYQPKIRLSDGQTVGAEALLRWPHPEHGMIPPGRFIPVAETSDLIVELGVWMLGEVCRQLARWRADGLPILPVAVNLAARHFRQPGLADCIRGLLEASALPAQALELELTESSLLEAGPQTAETLQALEELGVGLAIDDFGTGYSSLSYLKRLPLCALKIDQSFVRDLVSDPDDRTIAAAIVALGHGLGLKVIAEGVETAEQQCILLDQGCDLAQGFWFGHPVPPEAFVTAWQANSARAGLPME
jgi:diguanylate cyclase (GGDEF)-like protein/PAS domain S-box-containing protein